MKTNIPTVTENARLDALTSYTSTILNHLQGDQLNAALTGLVKRHGRSDRDFRAHALQYTHPDDLCTALVLAGYTLQTFGIESIQLAA